MNLDGATVRLEHRTEWAPLVYADKAWRAKLSVTAGSYLSGEIKFPNGSILDCRMSYVIHMVERGQIVVIFPELEDVGAEITRRMMALAA